MSSHFNNLLTHLNIQRLEASGLKRVLEVDVDGELAEVVPMEVVLVVLDLVKDLIDSSQRSESLGGKA